ncbi:multicopper oxidase family protein [Candidatus Peregrinibacteria bacterium]|nr:multicopper oxidase family protein [Candidatus Peregrinibacteria bacterium]
MRNTYFISASLIAVISLLTACSAPDAMVQESKILQASKVVQLQNGDSYELSASYVDKEINGKTYRMLAYNGSIPGPLIKVVQGSEVTINFKNDTDMKTLLHSHGVRMDNQFDGAQTSQKEMKPGESFSYKLKFPDAGIYWYHPHVREDYQQELGLYGNFLVTPRDENYFNPVNREVALYLDDILIEDQQIKLDKDLADHALMGRFGNVMLLSGETDYQLEAEKGEVLRFFLTNSANSRPFNFAIEGQKLKLVGSDGGAYEKEEWLDEVLVGPSERIIVEVLFAASGDFEIQNRTPDETVNLGKISVSDKQVDTSYESGFDQLHSNEFTIQSIEPFKSFFDIEPDKEIKLDLEMGMEHGGHMMGDGSSMGGSMMSMSLGADGIEWNDDDNMMNQMSDTDLVTWKIIDVATGKENMDLNWEFEKDKPVKIRIFNDPKSMHPMQHPIHFHGQRFLILERDGVKEKNLVWKDTVFIPSGETVDILLDTSNPGTWMAHCHIAEHLEAGMMFTFKIN